MTDCKKCKEHQESIFGDIGCSILRDWLTREERKTKKVLDDCPKKERK